MGPPAWTEQFKKQILDSIQDIIDKAMEKMRKNMETEFQKSFDYLETNMHEVECKVNEFSPLLDEHKARISSLENKQRDMSERILSMESYSMRDNLIFTGLPEVDGETDTDIRNILKSVFTDDLKLDGDMISISRCHRLDKRHRPHDRSRDIIVKFTQYSDRQKVLYSGKHLKGKNPPVYINEQFPAEIEKRRNILRPIVKLAKSKNMRAVLSRDKLVIDGKAYTVDTLDAIPLNIKDTATITTDHHVFFNGRLSPFSNFYKCKLEIDGSCYSCVEQYFQHAKAVLGKDTLSAGEIMLATDPAEIKRIGRRVTDSKWTAKKQLEVMNKALRAKYEQNNALLEQLISTGQRQLVEANAYDSFWGIGRGLRDSNISNSSYWNGPNNLGKLLDAIRDENAPLA
jgi:ribA/ribD-fused uncharacterized protein